MASGEMPGFDAYDEVGLLMLCTVSAFAVFLIANSYEPRNGDAVPSLRAARAFLWLGRGILAAGLGLIVVCRFGTGGRWLEGVWFGAGMMALGLLPRLWIWFRKRRPDETVVNALLFCALVVAFVGVSCQSGWWLGQAIDGWSR